MKIFICYALLFSISSFGQEDLEDIFNDGDKDSRFRIGTEVLPLITTVPNINMGIYIFEDFVIQPGIGIIPFGFYYDLNNWRPGSGGFPILDYTTSLGLYYDFSAKYEIMQKSDVSLFVQGSYQHWNYEYKNDFTVNRFKTKLGAGNEFGLGGRFNFTLRYGFMIGRDRMTYHKQESFEEFDQLSERKYSFGFYKKAEQTKFMAFLDFNMSLTYGL